MERVCGWGVGRRVGGVGGGISKQQAMACVEIPCLRSPTITYVIAIEPVGKHGAAN